jgi:hypothetical protein
MVMVDLLDTLVFDTLPSTLRCVGMLYRLAVSTFVSIHMMPSSQSMSSRKMVSCEGVAFSNRVLHYATSLRGTRQYWLKQRSQLTAMVETLGLPTVFFIHSAADLQ